MKNCSSHFKPIVYRWFVDDTFLLLQSKDRIEKFGSYLNKQQKNIKFISEIEENDSLSFLDIKIKFENKFVTSVYCKPTFSRILKFFESFVPDIYKCGLIETLKSILKRNSYPHNLVNRCIKKFLNKLFIQWDLHSMVPERELICILPY